jgi:hypothetical protein
MIASMNEVGRLLELSDAYRGLLLMRSVAAGCPSRCGTELAAVQHEDALLLEASSAG